MCFRSNGNVPYKHSIMYTDGVKQRKHSLPQTDIADHESAGAPVMSVLSDCVTCLESWPLSTLTKSNEENQSAKRRRTSSLTCSIKVVPVFSPSFSCFVAVDKNGVGLRVIDLKSRQQAEEIPGHKHEITSLAIFDEQACVLSGGYDSIIKRWKLNRTDCASTTMTLVNEVSVSNVICKLIAHPFRQMVLIWMESNLLKLKHLSDITSDEVSIHVQDSNVVSLTQNEDQIIYGTDKGLIYVWSYESTTNPVFKLDTGEGSVFLLDVVCTTLASWTTKQRQIIVWNIEKRETQCHIDVSPCPSFLSLTTEARHVIFIDTKRQLHVTSLSKPSEHQAIASFEHQIIMSSPISMSQQFWVVLRNWEVLKLKIKGTASCSDNNLDGRKRSSSTACVIL